MRLEKLKRIYKDYCAYYPDAEELDFILCLLKIVEITHEFYDEIREDLPITHQKLKEAFDELELKI